MISLTRLSGSVFVLNADLIERLDSTPDTVITLVDGKKYVVAESMSEVVESIRAYRSAVIGFTVVTGPEQPPARPHLVPVTQHPASAEGGE